MIVFMWNRVSSEKGCGSSPNHNYWIYWYYWCMGASWGRTSAVSIENWKYANLYFKSVCVFESLSITHDTIQVRTNPPRFNDLNSSLSQRVRYNGCWVSIISPFVIVFFISWIIQWIHFWEYLTLSNFFVAVTNHLFLQSLWSHWQTLMRKGVVCASHVYMVINLGFVSSSFLWMLWALRTI